MIGANLTNANAAHLLTFKLILTLNNNWEEYRQKQPYPLRQVEIEEVEKMLLCMDPEQGYSVYMCEGCGSTKIVPHSCKSRICSICGKKHADEWSEKINRAMYAVPYRHIILTVSDRLWPYFEGNARLQKIMLDTAAKVMKDIVRNFNKTEQKADPGIIMVLHPFGRDLKTNMHVHMLMTEGGLTSSGDWVEMPYIDYRIIRKKWQYEILTALKKALPEDEKLLEIIDWCFRERKNGFNIQAKRRIEGKTQKAARYMARYVRHPAIADSRIIGYDGKNVTFVYQRESRTCTVVMDKFEFIHNVIKHIPDAHFKMVRYYGIHSRKSCKSVRTVMEKLGLVVQHIIKPFTWRKNVEEYTGKDPLKCTKCAGEMLLYKIFYRNKHGEMKEYGGLDMFLKKVIPRGRAYHEKEEEKKKAGGEEKTKHYQLCLC